MQTPKSAAGCPSCKGARVVQVKRKRDGKEVVETIPCPRCSRGGYQTK